MGVNPIFFKGHKLKDFFIIRRILGVAFYRVAETGTFKKAQLTAFLSYMISEIPAAEKVNLQND